MSACDIALQLKHEGVDVDVRIPNSGEQLIEIVSSFKGVIAARLHSCIVAYSLDIPCVGLVWNSKVKYFGTYIGYPERLVQDNQMTADNVIQLLEMAIRKGYIEVNRMRYRMSIVNNIKAIKKEFNI